MRKVTDFVFYWCFRFFSLKESTKRLTIINVMSACAGISVGISVYAEHGIFGAISIGIALFFLALLALCSVFLCPEGQGKYSL